MSGFSTADQPIAAPLADLEQCGLVEETLVVRGGEFGRMPFREGLSPEELTYFHEGRKERLTDVAIVVVTGVLS